METNDHDLITEPLPPETSTPMPPTLRGVLGSSMRYDQVMGFGWVWPEQEDQLTEPESV